MYEMRYGEGLRKKESRHHRSAKPLSHITTVTAGQILHRRFDESSMPKSPEDLFDLRLFRKKIGGSENTEGG